MQEEHYEEKKRPLIAQVWKKHSISHLEQIRNNIALRSLKWYLSLFSSLHWCSFSSFLSFFDVVAYTWICVTPATYFLSVFYVLEKSWRVMLISMMHAVLLRVCEYLWNYLTSSRMSNFYLHSWICSIFRAFKISHNQWNIFSRNWSTLLRISHFRTFFIFVDFLPIRESWSLGKKLIWIAFQIWFAYLPPSKVSLLYCVILALWTHCKLQRASWFQN